MSSQLSIMDVSYGMTVISPLQINSNDFKTKPGGVFWGSTEPPAHNTFINEEHSRAVNTVQ